MFEKEETGVRWWRYPECFQCLLETQGTDGGWDSGTAGDEMDSILNPMAALLAFKKHAAQPRNCEIPTDISACIQKVIGFLQTKLNCWDVERSDYVAFEILVPTLFQ